jgi:hypothetical protein
MHDVLATNRRRATDEMTVFGTHPYKRSSVLAWGFPDSHASMQQRATRAFRSSPRYRWSSIPVARAAACSWESS